jgi:hypothetical protein
MTSEKLEKLDKITLSSKENITLKEFVTTFNKS